MQKFESKEICNECVTENKFELLFKSLPDPAIIVDSKGKFLAINKKAEKKIGINKEELIGKSFLKIKFGSKITNKALLLKQLTKRMMGSNIDPYEIEFSVDGKIIVFEVSAKKIDYEGKQADLAIFRDITDRKAVEKKLIESEQRYRNLVNYAGVPIVTTDKKGNFNYLNKAAIELFGYSSHEMLSRSFRDFLHPEDKGKIFRLFLNIGLLNRQPRMLEFRVLNKDRRVLNLLSKPSKLKIEGKTVGFQAIIVDITERKDIEEKLKESEEKFRNLAEESPNMIFINKDGRILYANQKCVDIMGFKKEDFYSPNFNFLTLIAPESRHIVKKSYESHKKEMEVVPYEYTLITKDGQRIEGILTSKLIKYGNENAILWIITDISGQKLIETELRNSKQFLEAIIDNIPFPAFIKNKNFSFMMANKAYCELLGKSKDEVIGSNDYKHHSNEEADLIRKKDTEVIEKKSAIDIYEHLFKDKDGNTKTLLVKKTPLKNEKGDATHIISIIDDITEHKRMSEKLKGYSKYLEEVVSERTAELHKSVEKFKHIYNASLNAIYTTSIEGKILEMNPVGVSMFGFRNLDELKKINIKDLYVNPEDRERFVELARKGIVKRFETKLRNKEEGMIDVIINSYPLKDENDEILGFQGAIIDISEQKRLDRMKDQFIASATHELRTPLISIMGYVEYILSDECEQISDEIYSDLQVIKRNADRLIKITDDLLDIRRIESGKLQLNLEYIDFRDIIRDCINEVKPIIGKRKNLHVKLPKKALPVQGDLVKLSQVCMNLLDNATKFTPDDGEIFLHVQDRDDAIKVQVSDTGLGIKKEDLERVFEPFASIEKPNYIKGTGLGLNVTKGLVEAHGGKIWVESEGKGKGSKFTFILPKKKKKVICSV
ncbi:hypothetical protein AC481_05740 [miscellaneous Crenarchaeota group archaeon SMTZ-80]|nr:MAG: hypothetical protein AC481_05740 [miscellaneous Crenarchaeota group archaeon SMTZ-80]